MHSRALAFYVGIAQNDLLYELPGIQAMRVEHLLPAIIQLACFIPPCYWLLSRSGISEKLLARASVLGFSLSACLIVLPATAYYLGKGYALTGALLVGALLSLVAIRKILGTRWLETCWSLVFLVFCFVLLSLPLQLLFKFVFTV